MWEVVMLFLLLLFEIILYPLPNSVWLKSNTDGCGGWGLGTAAGSKFGAACTGGRRGALKEDLGLDLITEYPIDPDPKA